MSDLVIVSNRGPFSFSSDFLSQAEAIISSGRRPEPPKFGEGGLVNAMAGLLKPGKWNPTWIGASMGDRDIDVARGYHTELFRKMAAEGLAPEEFPDIQIEPNNRMRFRYRDYDFHMRFVFFDTKHMHSYYSKFANGFLWPLMHLTRSPLFYKKAPAFPRPRFEKNDFVQYTSSGVTFANTVSDEIQRSRVFNRQDENLVVWNQDYHLMQIAEVCKAILSEEGLSPEAQNRIRMGQFMHTPFFNIHEIQGLIREDKRSRVKAQVYDPFGETIETVLQKLTWGMLANDFIGFHTKEYCDNYLEALEEWFPVTISIEGNFYEITHQEEVTTVGALPIGLDVDKILSESAGETVLEGAAEGRDLKEMINGDKAAGRHIFGGLERCDYTKGLVERLEIFFHARNRLTEQGQDARFYQITAPSRSENPDYQHLHSVLAEEVSRIDGLLGGGAIVHLDEGVPAPHNYRFMRDVDVMLVTPLEDGMNLVAFEYVLTQKNKPPADRGILVLSTSGASRVLKEKGFGEEDGVIHVNPLNPQDGGERTAEAIRKHCRLSDRLIDYVVHERRVDDWAESNMEAIMNCRKSPQRPRG